MGIIEFITKLFKRREYEALPETNKKPPIYDELKELGKEIEKQANLNGLIEDFRQIPELKTQFSGEQIIKIATSFFESLGIKENINVDTTIKHGDIRYLFQAVRQVTQRLSKIETNDQYIKVAPKCMEKILEKYLKNLSDTELKEFNLNRKNLQEDILLMNIIEAIKLKDNLKGPNDINMKSIIGKLYSTKFEEICNRDKLNQKGQFRLLLQTISAIKSGQKNILETDKNNLIHLRSLGDGVIQDTKNNINQYRLNKKLIEIMRKIEMGQDFKENIFGHTIFINLAQGLPFILTIPDNIDNNSTLIMESNNLASSNNQELFKQGLEISRSLLEVSNDRNPILVPILSNVENEPYWQQLSLDCIENDSQIPHRILETIEKSKKIIKDEKGIEVNNKIFLNGYSSSGVFAQRLALIYPEIIDTACIGGASGSIPIPDSRLDYPLGIKNYEELFQKPFDMDAYKNINFEYYVGSLESYVKSNRNGTIAPMHDMSYFAISVPTEIGKQQRELFGDEMFERAKKTVETLKEQGVKINHKILYNCIHNDKEAEKYNKENPGIPIVTGVREERDKIIKIALRAMKERQKNREKEEKNIPN